MIYDGDKRKLFHLTGHDTDNYRLIDEKCPKCGSEMYQCMDGGSQGGAPYKACVQCSFIKYK